MSVPEVPYARSSSQPSYISFPFYPCPSTPERCIIISLKTPLSRRWRARLTPGTLRVDDPHCGMCTLCRQGRKELSGLCFAVIEPAICLDMFSLIRHFLSTTSTSNSPALVWMYRKDPTRGCCWGRMGWEVQLIGNKRLWLSSLPLTSFVHAWTGRGETWQVVLQFRALELKVDIFVFEYGWF